MPKIKRLALSRQSLIRSIRQFFADNQFIEVSTPILSPFLIPESYLDFFQTKLATPEGRRRSVYLTPSPELWHKRLLAQGIGSIFEISHRFRNGDIGKLHRPEFWLLEWYSLSAGLQTSMRLTQDLIKYVVARQTIYYQGQKIDLTGEFESLSMFEAFEKYTGVTEDSFFDKGVLYKKARQLGLTVQKSDSWDDLYTLIYVSEVEPYLGEGKPTFIYNFPTQFAPLAKTNLKDPRFKDRFELFIAGVELADGYVELTDPEEQKQAFLTEIAAFKKQKKPLPKVDWQFIEVLEQGLPESSGVALGIDRLLMIILDKSDIKEVQLI